jgi:hypothetical protein
MVRGLHAVALSSPALRDSGLAALPPDLTETFIVFHFYPIRTLIGVLKDNKTASFLVFLNS